MIYFDKTQADVNSLQIRRAIIEKGVWKVVLPGLSSVREVKEDIEKERETVDTL